MAEGATIEVWNAQDMRYERRRVIRVRKGIPTLEEDGGIRVDGGRYAHLMRKEESESGQWFELHKENWRWAECGRKGTGRLPGRIGHETGRVMRGGQRW